MTKASFAIDLGTSMTALKEDGKFSLDKLTARAKSIGSRGYKLDVDIHAAAVATLYFAMPAGVSDVGNRNAEPARQLLSAMPKGSRAKTLADWFEAHSNVRLKLGKDGKWSVGLYKGTDAVPALTGAELTAKALVALEKPFWTVEEATKGAQAFDLNAAIIQLFAKADKAIEKCALDDDMLANVEKLRSFAKANGLPVAKAA